MTAFESYLIEQGYKKHIQQYINGKWVYLRTDKHTISTMVNIAHFYIKAGQEQIVIFGLNEKGKPPTLISPRPFTVMVVEGNDTYISPVRDDEMNRILSAYPPEVVLNAALTGKNLAIPEKTI